MGIHPLLFIRVLQMSQWRFPPDIPLPYKGYRDEDWQDNDGALNTISMTHPRIPVEHSNLIVQSDSDCLPPNQAFGVEFDLIYDSIFERAGNMYSKSPQTLPNEAQQLQLGGDQEE
ncbi:hypothetical protein Bca52824_063713 [Brassica carinata]|uniref:Uncharacterized protein n=1 Tax=Brassica carinata TaxID=52824 RepID=A0A8X7QGL7_BRACI|nr:hypothetical protein Bca52824_063713 [Brassica carinata]